MQAQKNIWRQLTWTWKPESERDAGDSVVRNLLLHWFPAKVTIASLSFRYSFWLGTISAVLFGILCVTGVLLMFLYVPSVERAYPVGERHRIRRFVRLVHPRGCIASPRT